MYCSKCGSQLTNEDAYCNGCGEKVISSNEPDTENTNSSQNTTNNNSLKKGKLKYGIIIICILLGAAFLFSKNNSPEKNIIGKWSSVVDGETVTLEFKKGGKLLVTEGNENIDTINYTIEKKSESKNTIIIKEVGDESSTELLNIDFEDKNNILLTTDNSSKILNFNRVK